MSLWTLIIKKFTIIYGNVKSFDLLMRDFYRADQGDDESIPSYATRIEGLLSQIRDKFLDQLPLQEEQRLLKDCLFHGSRKGIRASLKYCFADASIDYMQFLEECRKSEEEGKAGQARAPVKAKVKAAAATLTPNKDDGLSKATQISAASDRCLGGAGERLGGCCESHTYLPKSREEWVFIQWEREPRQGKYLPE